MSSLGTAEKIAVELNAIKNDFVKTHDMKKHVELIPISSSNSPYIPEEHLKRIQNFMIGNKMYGNYSEKNIRGHSYMAYKGNPDKYWLDSTNYTSSLAPFRATWVMSAYVLGMVAHNLGYEEAVDIGSGDGRIAFCAGILGMPPYSIEIARSLVDLQKSNPSHNSIPSCADATTFEYGSLNLKRPVFFIGGLAQMGGDRLASQVMEKIRQIPGLWDVSGWVLPGTDASKYAADPNGHSGWGTIMRENHLEHVRTVSLPTAWTLDGSDSTPYVFARPES